MTCLDALPLWNDCNGCKWITDVISISSRYTTMHRFLSYVVHGEAVSDLGFTLNEDKIHILYLQTDKKHRRKGYASQLLRTILHHADESNMPLSLLACPYGETAYTKRQLEGFYRRRGFTAHHRDVSGFARMIRHPLSEGIAA